jgi:hypothetical protein
MPKPKSARTKIPRSPKSKTAVRKSETQSKVRSSIAAGRAESKQARLITMLRASSGATVAAMMAATEWQQHSVRGFLAGVIRKKLASTSFPKRATMVGSIVSRIGSVGL